MLYQIHHYYCHHGSHHSYLPVPIDCASSSPPSRSSPILILRPPPGTCEILNPPCPPYQRPPIPTSTPYSTRYSRDCTCYYPPLPSATILRCCRNMVLLISKMNPHRQRLSPHGSAHPAAWDPPIRRRGSSPFRQCLQDAGQLGQSYLYS